MPNESVSVSEYTTYPRRFLSYRWFKPLLVALVSALAYLILVLVLIVGCLVIDYITGADHFSALQGGYDTLDAYSAVGALLTLGSIAYMIPALLIGALIVRDRPFSSYGSSRGGWDFSVFFRCLGGALLLCGVPVLVQSIFFDEPTGVVRFTVVGFILCTILTPLQCAAEEYLFRGFLMQTFGSWFRLPILAIVLQAAAFASQHPYNMVGVFVILLDGICFGIVAWYTKGLEAGTALHVVNNMTAFYATGFGFGSIGTEIDVSSIFWTIGIDVAYLLFLMLLGKRRGWFGRVRRDDAAEFNAAVEAQRARKAARREARLAKKD